MTEEEELSEVFGTRYTERELTEINRNNKRENLKLSLVVEGDLRKEQYLRVLNSIGFVVVFLRGTAKIKKIGKWHYSTRITTMSGDSVVITVSTVRRFPSKMPKGKLHIDLREPQQLERMARNGNLTNTWHDQNLPYKVK